MSFENKSTDELIRIAQAGLGFTLNSMSISSEDLHKIASAAHKSGARVTIIHSPELAFEKEISVFNT